MLHTHRHTHTHPLAWWFWRLKITEDSTKIFSEVRDFQGACHFPTKEPTGSCLFFLECLNDPVLRVWSLNSFWFCFMELFPLLGPDLSNATKWVLDVARPSRRCFDTYFTCSPPNASSGTGKPFSTLTFILSRYLPDRLLQAQFKLGRISESIFFSLFQIAFFFFSWQGKGLGTIHICLVQERDRELECVYVTFLKKRLNKVLSTQRDASRNWRGMDLSIFNVRIW